MEELGHFTEKNEKQQKIYIKKAKWEALVFLPVCGPVLLDPSSLTFPAVGRGRQRLERLRATLERGLSWLRITQPPCDFCPPWEFTGLPSPGGRGLLVTACPLAWPEWLQETLFLQAKATGMALSECRGGGSRLRPGLSRFQKGHGVMGR